MYNYFEEIKSMCTDLESAAKCFNSLLGAFGAKRLGEASEELFALSKSVYSKRCSVESEVHSDFITPIEREDIISIIYAIERGVRGFCEACTQMKIWGIARSMGDAIEFSDLALRCSSGIKKFSYGFERFRKNKSLRQSIRDAAETARRRDTVYAEAMSALVGRCSNREEIFAWSAIYSSLDEMCYRCECICEAFGIAILKNI